MLNLHMAQYNYLKNKHFFSRKLQLTVKKIGPQICCKASHIGKYLDSMIDTGHPTLKKGSNTYN